VTNIRQHKVKNTMSTYRSPLLCATNQQ